MNIYSASSPISKSIKVVGVIAFGKFLESAFYPKRHVWASDQLRSKSDTKKQQNKKKEIDESCDYPEDTLSFISKSQFYP